MSLCAINRKKRQRIKKKFFHHVYITNGKLSRKLFVFKRSPKRGDAIWMKKKREKT